MFLSPGLNDERVHEIIRGRFLGRMIRSSVAGSQLRADTVRHRRIGNRDERKVCRWPGFRCLLTTRKAPLQSDHAPAPILCGMETGRSSSGKGIGNWFAAVQIETAEAGVKPGMHLS
jgi:hypothetical protein